MATKHIDEFKKTRSRYISGFILSITFTLASYIIVQVHRGSGDAVLSQPVILVTILVFAIAQLIVQLYFFLHLNEENGPRWRLMALLLAAMVVSIVVIGSIWIMSNLNYRMMRSPQAMNQYIHSQGDL